MSYLIQHAISQADDSSLIRILVRYRGSDVLTTAQDILQQRTGQSLNEHILCRPEGPYRKCLLQISGCGTSGTEVVKTHQDDDLASLCVIEDIVDTQVELTSESVQIHHIQSFDAFDDNIPKDVAEVGLENQYYDLAPSVAVDDTKETPVEDNTYGKVERSVATTSYSKRRVSFSQQVFRDLVHLKRC